MNDYEKVWDEFWKPLVEKDGKPDMDLIKKELYDYYHVIDNVSHVYCHCTGGLLSKPNYKSRGVIEAIETYYEDLYTREEL